MGEFGVAESKAFSKFSAAFTFVYCDILKINCETNMYLFSVLWYVIIFIKIHVVVGISCNLGCHLFW